MQGAAWYSSPVSTACQDSPVVGAIVTAFEPSSTLEDAVDSVKHQVDVIVVVDDGSTSEGALARLDDLESRGIFVVRQSSNQGIGAALNAGVRALDAWGAVDGVLTLDQDSKIDDLYVQRLIVAAREAHCDGIKVGMISPASVGSIGQRPGTASRNRGYALGKEPIQSGLLVPRKVLRMLNGFREDLFIDGVDSDFYLRARRLGYTAIMAPGVHLVHRLGRAHRVRILGQYADFTVAANFRYYYQARNLIKLLRAHALTAPGWSFGAAVRQGRHLALVSALVPGRSARWREYVRGLGDGVRGRGGRRPDDAGFTETGSGSNVRGAGPRVSVCMATWNGSAFVKEQLRSILDQLGKGDEIVIVDDASQDDTVQQIRAIDDPRIRLIVSSLNRGYVRTFESALREARNEVLLLADQDDVWCPGRVCAMVEDLARGDIVATNLATLDGPPRIRGPFGQKDWRVKSVTSGHRVRNTLKILAGDMPYFGCAMGLRRAAIEAGALPFPSFLTESHDLWLGLFGNLTSTMVHGEYRSVSRRYHDSNATPNRPRGLAGAVRSRVLLIRCLVEIAKRRRAHKHCPCHA